MGLDEPKAIHQLVSLGETSRHLLENVSRGLELGSEGQERRAGRRFKQNPPPDAETRPALLLASFEFSLPQREPGINVSTIQVRSSPMSGHPRRTSSCVFTWTYQHPRMSSTDFEQHHRST